MAGLADREAAKDISESYQFLVGDVAFHFTVDHGSIQLHDGSARDPAVIWSTDEETWADIASANITVSSATARDCVPDASPRYGALRPAT